MKRKYLFLLLAVLAALLSACGADNKKEAAIWCREEKEELSPEKIPAAYHKNGKCFSYSVREDGRVYLMYSPEKEGDYYSAALYSPEDNSYSPLPFEALEEDMGFVEIMEAPDGTVMLLTTTTPSGLYEKTEEGWELRVAAEKTSLSQSIAAEA